MTKYFIILHSNGTMGLYDTDREDIEDMLKMMFSVSEITKELYEQLERQVP